MILDSSKCFYSTKGLTSRCTSATLIGTATLDGAQAGYLRIPHADSTAVHAPPSINPKFLILMADIFPTGYFAAKNAYTLLSPHERQDPVIAVVGCGPVGLCAVVSALALFKPRHLFAVDAVPARLAQAKELGAEPLNFQTDMDGMKRRIFEVTDGRGADA